VYTLYIYGEADTEKKPHRQQLRMEFGF
jgi:hypothetical protein